MSITLKKQPQMKRIICVLSFTCLGTLTMAQPQFPTSLQEDKEQIMSEAYWKIWNPKVQKQIDRDIEKNRKANGVLNLEEAAPGTEVEIKQVSHDFLFGASMFNFNQLGTPAANQRYKELFGTLFNRATVPFYWEPFEMQPGRPRFREEYWDTEAYWNKQTDPKHQPHWRRPAPDPMIDYCESHGIPVHGHPLTWGRRRWHHPNWIVDQILTDEERQTLKQYVAEYADEKNFRNEDKMTPAFNQATPQELEEKLPELGPKLQQLINKRITEIVKYYGDRISSWDVVNESAQDFAKGAMIPGSKLCKSNYGFMPGDFTYESFQTAGSLISDNALMNINDYWTGPEYAAQVKDLLKRGCRIDVVGTQMHLFNPQQCLDIAAGKESQTPSFVWKLMNNLSETGLPIHLSEITITSPGGGTKGEQIQAVIAQNLYRLWFSCKNMMGITWWNIVDDCGAPGEPSVSGLFHRDMSPKQSFYALDNLINHAWKTETKVKAGKNGEVKFRGFRGQYEVTYTDKNGKERTVTYHLK